MATYKIFVETDCGRAQLAEVTGNLTAEELLDMVDLHRPDVFDLVAIGEAYCVGAAKELTDNRRKKAKYAFIGSGVVNQPYKLTKEGKRRFATGLERFKS